MNVKLFKLHIKDKIGAYFFILLITVTSYSSNNFMNFLLATMTIITFNLKMSHVAMETVEIN